jgi:hypothetical protein
MSGRILNASDIYIDQSLNRRRLITVTLRISKSEGQDLQRHQTRGLRQNPAAERLRQKATDDSQNCELRKDANSGQRRRRAIAPRPDRHSQPEGYPQLLKQ